MWIGSGKFVRIVNRSEQTEHEEHEHELYREKAECGDEKSHYQDFIAYLNGGEPETGLPKQKKYEFSEPTLDENNNDLPHHLGPCVFKYY